MPYPVSTLLASTTTCNRCFSSITSCLFDNLNVRILWLAWVINLSYIKLNSINILVPTWDSCSTKLKKIMFVFIYIVFKCLNPLVSSNSLASFIPSFPATSVLITFIISLSPSCCRCNWRKKEFRCFETKTFKLTLSNDVVFSFTWVSNWKQEKWYCENEKR